MQSYVEHQRQLYFDFCYAHFCYADFSPEDWNFCFLFPQEIPEAFASTDDVNMNGRLSYLWYSCLL